MQVGEAYSRKDPRLAARVQRACMQIKGERKENRTMRRPQNEKRRRARRKRERERGLTGKENSVSVPGRLEIVSQQRHRERLAAAGLAHLLTQMPSRKRAKKKSITPSRYDRQHKSSSKVTKTRRRNPARTKHLNERRPGLGAREHHEEVLFERGVERDPARHAHMPDVKAHLRSHNREKELRRHARQQLQAARGGSGGE